MAFPTTSVLDDFNRANEGPPPSASWVSTGIIDASPGLSVVSNTMADSASFSGGAWGTQFGADTEVYVTVSTLMTNIENARVLGRATNIGNSSTVDGYMFLFERNDAFPGFEGRYYRYDNGSVTQLGASVVDTGGALSAGVKFGMEIVGDVLTGYVNRASWSSLATRTDSTYAASGYIGFYASDTTGRYDDFGGGTVGGAADTGLAWIVA